MSVDYVVVGSGLFGATFARRAAEAGCSVLVVDRRSHIGGNCYTEDVGGVNVHRYGPHIFHTSNERVWEFVNRFATFNRYRHRGRVRSAGRLFSFPINLLTLHQLWGVMTPAEAEQKLAAVRRPVENPANLEEWILGQVGEELYETFVKGYTMKQWGREPAELPASIIRRIPIRLTWDDNYFDDQYQGIPVGGYTLLFENLLDHDSIRVETDVDFFAQRGELEKLGNKLVYTGKIDEFFDYRYGPLEYRSLRFETEVVEGDFQGASIINYGDAAVPFTRIVEHKHFEFNESKRSVITREYPQAYEAGREAFYPIGDAANQGRYQLYKDLAAKEAPSVRFGGRLGSYKYFDMHQVIGQALKAADDELAPVVPLKRAA